MGGTSVEDGWARAQNTLRHTHSLSHPLFSNKTNKNKHRANFVLWVAYLLFSPAHLPLIPFWPFAPGSFGIADAFA